MKVKELIERFARDSRKGDKIKYVRIMNCVVSTIS